MGECGWQLEDVRPHEYTKINKHTYPETDFWNVVIPVGSMRDDGSVLFKNLSGNYEWFKVGDSFLLLGSEQYTIKKFEPNKIGDSFLLLGSEQYTIKKFELKQYSKCVMLASVKSGCQCPQCMSKFDEIDKMRMKRI
jgi:hypothetical protein